jgi:hypothetical protein
MKTASKSVPCLKVYSKCGTLCYDICVLFIYYLFNDIISNLDYIVPVVQMIYE